MQAGVRRHGRKEQGAGESPIPTGAGAQGPASTPDPVEDPLTRLLRRWGVPPVALQPAVAQLTPLLDWTDAVHLAQALTPCAPGGIGAGDLQALKSGALAALRRLQVETCADFADALLARESSEPLATPLPLADALAPYRLHHAQRQRAMAARVGALRQQLREQLVGSGRPRLRQLAGFDAVFERALAAHASRALAELTARLFGARAERHQQQDALRWRRLLWRDLQDALQAELALRLLPLRGLIEALQPPSTE